MNIHYTRPDINDLKELMHIENLGFRPDEAATEKSMRERIKNIPDTFIVARDEQDKIIGYVVGPVINHRYLTDELFENTHPNPPSGGFQSILSLVVHPDYRGQGIATRLLERLEEACKKSQRSGITLTCLDDLIPFYEAIGFVNEGKSVSTHAGDTWFNLVKEL
ncbi:GNAT family N-acetyltransferase [Heyndrickxia oleronia]|uniref:GNAT family N-acetyltransferase n=1 Tax=Heyndrickxia oleronia TaxID=38875 RepID=UPI0030B8A74F